jgi:ribosome-binding factor A
MAVDRLARINQLLRQEVAEQLFRVMNEQGFDMAAITVVRVDTSANLRHARVYVSIRGDAQQQQRMLRQLSHHRHEIQSLIGRHVVMKYTPQLEFVLDESIAQGDRVLQVIAEIEAKTPESENEPGV